MLKNEKLIHRLTLEQKISLIVSNKEYTREQVADYEFPIFSLLEKPYELVNGNKTVIFPSQKTIAKTWNNKLISDAYACLGYENDRLSDELFFRTKASINTNFIDDPFLLGNYIAAASSGLEKTTSKLLLEKFNVSSNFELSMLPSDIAIDNGSISYILLNDVNELEYYKEIDKYNNVFFGNTEYKEMVLKFISNGISLIFYKGDIAELVEYISHAVNEYKVREQQYKNGEIPLSKFNVLINEGKILSIDKINEACDNVIELLVKVKDFRNKEKLNEFLTPDIIRRDFKKFEEVSKQVARESIVLLKNTNLALPLSFNDKVAIIGEPFENIEYLSSKLYTSPTSLYSGLSLIDNYEEITYTGFAHGYILDGEEDPDLLSKAIELANESDKVILYLQMVEGEENLRDNQLRLLQELRKTEKHIIVCLLTDGYVNLDFIDLCDSLLYCESLGQYTHEAILDIVTGRYDTTGRLTSEYPLLLADESVDDNNIPSYCFEKPNLFPFGYGLSLAEYELSDITITENDVCFHVHNLTDYDGYVVPQLYISKGDTLSSLNSKLLRGYAKVEVLANETVKVCIPFNKYTFRKYDEYNMSYGIEGGEYNIFIGLNAEDVKLSGVIKLDKYLDRKKENNLNLLESDLDEAKVLHYMATQKSKNTSKKTRIILYSLLIIYLLVSLIIVIFMGDGNPTINIVYSIIAGLIVIFAFIKLLKTRKEVEQKPTVSPNETLTKMIDEVKCFNPIATYKYDESDNVVVEKFAEENENSDLNESKNVEEQNKENTEDIEETYNENEDVEEYGELEDVEVEPQTEEVESIYDEEATLSFEEIQNFEANELEVLEKQELSKLLEFEQIVNDEIEFNTDQSVTQVIDNFAKFARDKGLIIDINSIRSLFSALAGSRMVFLTTNREDMIDNLLNIINTYFGNSSTITTASDKWASLFSISWIKDENGEYIKTPFIQEMYNAGQLKNNFNLSIIKNVDLDNFELYFRRCIDFANNPTRNISLDISKQLKVYIPHNMHFIIVPKEKDYLKKINKNIADAATFIEVGIQEVIEPSDFEGSLNYISENYFGQLIHTSLQNSYLSEDSWKKIDELFEEINKYEEIELPNKSVLQIERFSAIFIDSGGDELELLDRVLATKIMPLIKTMELVASDDGYKFVKDLLERIFGAENIKLTLGVLAIRKNY